MLKLHYSKQFKKDFKLSQKHGLPMQKLKTILEKLVNGIPLVEKHHDHPLSGNYTSFRECHIEPDWLLIYKSTKMSLYSLLRELEHIVICLENDTCPPTGGLFSYQILIKSYKLSKTRISFTSPHITFMSYQSRCLNLHFMVK